MALAFRSVGTYLAINAGTSAAVAVPAGVANLDIVVVCIMLQTNQAITGFAAGFAEAPNSPVTVTGTNAHTHHILWKRASGADSGTYTFSWNTSDNREAFAIAYSGGITSGSPWDGTPGTAINATSTTTSPAVSMTTTVANTMLLWLPSDFAQGGYTPPATFTERQDNGVNRQSAAEKAQATAAAVGPFTGTGVSSAWTVWLGALKPDTGAITKAELGRDQAGLASTSTSAKRAVQTGRSMLGAHGRSVSAKRAVQTGPAALGLSGRSTAVHRAVETGVSALPVQGVAFYAPASSQDTRPYPRLYPWVYPSTAVTAAQTGTERGRAREHLDGRPARCAVRGQLARARRHRGRT